MGEPHHKSGNMFRLEMAIERGDDLGVVDRIGHSSARGGQDAVGGYARLNSLPRKAAGKTEDSRLGGAIGGDSRIAEHAARGGGDNPPAAGAQQMRPSGSQHLHRAAEMNIENAGPFLRRAVGKSRRVHNSSRSEEHTSELQSLMRISYAVFCLKKKKNQTNKKHTTMNKNKNQ